MDKVDAEKKINLKIKTLFSRKNSQQLAKSKSISRLQQSPLNAELHFQYSQECYNKGKLALALAELKTSQTLGLNSKEILQFKSKILQELPNLEEMNHNQYYRLYSLSQTIKKLSKKEQVSVLDVGGGQGQLAQFLPDYPYCLAEPSINGISGVNLPFNDKSFDFVVACHVLEHILPNKRELFLNQVLSKSKIGTILLNPFYLEKTHVEDRLKLVYEVTGLDWAKEHLDCILPKIDMVKNYCKKNNLKFTITPNGTFTTSLAMMFANHFAQKAGISKELKNQINKFYNTRYKNILDSEECPNSFIVFIERK